MRIHPSQHPLAERHLVLDNSLQPPFPEDTRWIGLGLGCFWGAEKTLWQVSNVYTTAVGYAGGQTADPTYREVCAGNTGHAETVLVVYRGDDEVLEHLLDVFWESHDPTQGMRQGNDVGSQYRSAIYVDDESELELALASRDRYQQALTRAGYGSITTEIATGRDFYYAEDYHQQYLVKNPAGYCGLGGTGVAAR
jgi:peptide-methionine (S)-S-oxide reductase